MVFRDLNCSQGCSPLGNGVYPRSPFADFYDATTFRVGQGIDEFPRQIPKSVALQLQLSPSTLDYGQLRLEPAITTLDRLFTPYHRLQEHLHVEPLRTSTTCYCCFILPTVRSNGFGSYQSDSKAFSYLFPGKLRKIGFPASTPMIGLLLPLWHTSWHVIQNGR
jgi:hypothetical protein